MQAIRIVALPEPEEGWMHRFRNFGQDVYVQLRDDYDVSLEEIEAAVDTFHVREIPPERMAAVTDTLSRIVSDHHLEDSVFLVEEDPACAHRTVTLIVDPAFGERLGPIALRDLWVVPSEVNRAAVEQLWKSSERPEGRPSVTIWSGVRSAVTEEDWLGMLDPIELHHGAYSSSPPMDTLNVYGATLTPEIMAALGAYDFEVVKSSESGFIAFKQGGGTAEEDVDLRGAGVPPAGGGHPARR